MLASSFQMLLTRQSRGWPTSECVDRIALDVAYAAKSVLTDFGMCGSHTAHIL